MLRSNEQRDILVASLDQKFAQQAHVMEYISTHIVGLRVGDFGCGHGLPLRYLAERHPAKRFLGIDGLRTLLDANVARTLPNVELRHSVLTEFLPEGEEALGTVVFNRSLHEVFSTDGVEGLEATLSAAHAALAPHGRMIIYENVIHSRDNVQFRILDPEVRELFRRFLRDYSIRPVSVHTTGDVIVMGQHDALEFLTKYREEDWESEMREAHFIYTLSEWVGLLRRCGFEALAHRSFDDRQILRTDGLEVGWHIEDFKHVMVFERSA